MDRRVKWQLDTQSPVINLQRKLEQENCGHFQLGCSFCCCWGVGGGGGGGGGQEVDSHSSNPWKFPRRVARFLSARPRCCNQLIGRNGSGWVEGEAGGGPPTEAPSPDPNCPSTCSSCGYSGVL